MAPYSAEKAFELLDDVDRTKISDKKRYPGFRKNLYNYFTEYSSNTGIHGFKYLGEQKRTVAEKIYWLAFFCFSLYLCVFFIVDSWIKWEISPTIVSFAHVMTPVWQIPFPAVTVCPETKSKQTVFNYTEFYQKVQDMEMNFGNMTSEELKNISYASLVCKNYPYKNGENIVPHEVINFLTEIAPEFKDVFISCRWTSLLDDCIKMFRRTLTEDGVCFTFNMLDTFDIFKEDVHVPEMYVRENNESSGWTLEQGYPEEAGINTFPRRVMSEGLTAGMSLLLSMEQEDLDYVCRGGVQGFKMLLHNPAETPRISNQYFFVPLDDKETVISIIPEIIETSPSLQDYDPSVKQCYFSYERKLKYFRSYTQQNCQVECLTNLTLAKCGCAAYHMPRESSTPICGSGRIDCMKEAAGKFYKSIQGDQKIAHFCRNSTYAGILGDDIELDYDVYASSCDCLPSCSSISYTAEISQVDFLWKESYKAFKAPIVNPDKRFSRIFLFFKEPQFTTMERNELFGWTDFLSNCGGLLGLFTGFSFISIVEIVYYLSLKLICNIRRYGKYYWSGSKNLINNRIYLH